MSYEKEFKIFSDNLDTAKRAFYYHKNLNILANKEPKILEELNKNARFWLDYQHFSILTTIITLGKIFDKDKNSHKIEKLIKAGRNTSSFTKIALRKRKIQSSLNYEGWIDYYIDNAYELSEKDWDNIDIYIKSLRKTWENNFQDIRHKIVAHQMNINEQIKVNILEKGDGKKLEDIITKLVKLKLSLEIAYNNGSEINLDANLNYAEATAEKELKNLFYYITPTL